MLLKDFVYMVKVDPYANNNKFYKMKQLSANEWVAEYGRIGAGPQRRKYPMSKWYDKYQEKQNKGYVDQTHLYQENVTVIHKDTTKYREIPDKVISHIVERLQLMAAQAIRQNYTIRVESVTQSMIDEADRLISRLAYCCSDIYDFNEVLVTLFSVLPRRMSRVENYLVKDKGDMVEVLQREQDLLDVMRGQVTAKVVEKEVGDTGKNHDCTILEAFGLEIKPVTDADVNKIHRSLGKLSYRYLDAWKVVNRKTQEAFDTFVKDNGIKKKKLLWHGSRNENWWSIIRTGLVLRPSAVITGKMFGYGIYFAPKPQKSLGYCSLSGSYWANGSEKTGFMALYDTAYGIPYEVKDFTSDLSRFDFNKLKKTRPDAHCLHAKASRGITSLLFFLRIILDNEILTLTFA